MARLQESLLTRVESSADRTLDVVDVLETRMNRQRIIEQIAAAGTSVGANVFEADEAMSRPDFCRCLAICVKELNECRFWFRLIGRRKWVSAASLKPLEAECNELRRIFGTMISKTRSTVRPKGKAKD